MAGRKGVKKFDDVSLDEVMEEAIGEMREAMGESTVLVGGSADAKHVGLYIPHLSLRYLLQSTVLPLGGRMMQIAGKEMSNKSSLLYWFYKFFRNCRGKGHHIEVETKDSEPLRMSYLNYDEKAVQPYSADSLEDWQTLLLRFCDDKKGMKAKLVERGLADLYPLVFGVDSFMAKASRESQEKIKKDGFAGREHPVEALSVSKFLKTLPALFKDVPWFLIGTNHMKPSTDFMGRTIENVGGGLSLKFQETFRLILARTKELETANYSGNRIHMVARKNSIGTWNKEIEVESKWYIDRNTGRQITWWDWDEASIELLLGTNCPRDSMAKLKTRLGDLMDITGIQPFGAKGSGRAFSQKLNIPPDDPQSYSIVAKELEKHPDMLEQVHRLMGIGEHYVWTPGTSFREACEKARSMSVPTSYIDRALGATGVGGEDNDDDD